MEGQNMRELWIFSYVVEDNDTGNELIEEKTTCFSKEEAMKMLESKYAEDASMFEIIEEEPAPFDRVWEPTVRFFSPEKAWQQTEVLHMSYNITHLTIG